MLPASFSLSESKSVLTSTAVCVGCGVRCVVWGVCGVCVCVVCGVGWWVCGVCAVCVVWCGGCGVCGVCVYVCVHR